jgi:hypothetical protein
MTADMMRPRRLPQGMIFASPVEMMPPLRVPKAFKAQAMILFPPENHYHYKSDDKVFRDLKHLEIGPVRDLRIRVAGKFLQHKHAGYLEKHLYGRCDIHYDREAKILTSVLTMAWMDDDQRHRVITLATDNKIPSQTPRVSCRDIIYFFLSKFDKKGAAYFFLAKPTTARMAEMLGIVLSEGLDIWCPPS